MRSSYLSSSLVYYNRGGSWCLGGVGNKEAQVQYSPVSRARVIAYEVNVQTWIFKKPNPKSAKMYKHCSVGSDLSSIG